jgi:hypothetical protein
METVMTFKPRIWYPIAAVLSAVNVASVWFAAVPGEPLHATIHAALAVGFGLWALRLRQRAYGTSTLPDDAPAQIGEQQQAQLDAIDADMSGLRQELIETQERLDFAERMLAQRPDPRRVGPEGQGPG